MLNNNRYSDSHFKKSITSSLQEKYNLSTLVIKIK